MVTLTGRGGMSLVEVIVALAVLGIGVLGAAAMALHATSSLRQARAFEDAVLAATTTLDSLRQRTTVEDGERRVGRVTVRWTARPASGAEASRIELTVAYQDGNRARRITLSTLHLPPPPTLETAP